MEKRVNARELQKLAAKYREEPTEVYLHDLEHGDLFMCNLGAHSNYLYKFDKNVYVGGKLDHSLAWELGYIEGGDITSRGKGEPSNWNPYCGVYKVKIVVFPS